MIQKPDQRRWDEIFSSADEGISEPSGFLVKELDRLRLKGRALDLGCGAGRHCIELARRGFKTFGLDVSHKALGTAALNLLTAGLSANLEQGEMQSLPFRDAAFDLVASTNVLNHTDLEGARKSASEIRRVLRPGGYLIAIIATTRHHAFGQGLSVGEKVFLHQSGIESGIVHYYMDEEDVRSHFNGFDFECLAEETGSGFFKESKGKDNYHWSITARKRARQGL